jgi:uncharacterized RDD family membrane protein YckC
MKISWSEWRPVRPTDFLCGLTALLFLVLAFFLFGGANLFYSLDPLLAVLGFLFEGVLYFVLDSYFGEF